MSFLRELFFESLTLLLIAEVVAVGVAVAVHRRLQSPGSRRGLGITVAACLVLIGVQYLVVTDQEAIETLVRELARAVDAGDIAAMDERIDPGFRVGLTDKAQFLDTARQRLQEWRVDEVRVSVLRIEVAADEAHVRFRVFCDLRGPSDAQANVPSVWQIHCVKSEGQWRMAGIEDAEMGPGVLTKQGGMDLMPTLNLRR